MYSFVVPGTSQVGVGEGGRNTERQLLVVDFPDNIFKTNEFEQNFKA